jgi:acyl transferase domain-containing protein/NAD(P)-dependent dehydrogenase (short-subunit alcohol dehydrogenase family)
VKSADETQGVAIIGIGLLLPGAHTVSGFWRNILDGVRAIETVPTTRWDIHRSFDPNMSARDKAYSQWGGFATDIPFDPLQHRIPPNTMRSICTSQLLALELTRWALADAGYADREFDRTNTGVILGTDESSLLSEQLRTRTTLPHILEHIEENTLKQLPEWSGEMLPGVLSNVVAGRVANEFDLGGPNFIVNAACASSLVALDLAVRELQSHRSNMVITGGVDATQTPFFYVAFSKTQALSPRGVAAVFDQSADGIVLSEGACIMVVKRLQDAQRDGDRIYAVIRGIGASSDGGGRGITVPTVNGQTRAIRRALQDAQIEARTIELYEAHGTGTPLGDRTELDTLVQMLQEEGAPAKSCAVGSIKSLIGHTKLSAGAIGTAKAALSLYHKVLPAHFGLESPLESLTASRSPLYVVRHARPWLAPLAHPRRAAVSAFGFGGTNSHLILESSEHIQDAPLGADEWPCELLVFSGNADRDLLAQIVLVRDALKSGATPRLRDLAFTLALQADSAPPGPRLSLVCSTLDSIATDLAICEKVVLGDVSALPSHVAFSRHTPQHKGKIAFVFPGQGSQYINMAREQALFLPELRAALELSDRELVDCYPYSLSTVIYPPGEFTKQDQDNQQDRLCSTHHAQPAIGAISVGFADFLARLGIRPDMTAGHSYGELTAMHAAGSLSRQQLLVLSERRGRIMAQCCGNGGMVSVHASREQVKAILGEGDGATISNQNAPLQTVISGDTRTLAATALTLAAAGIRSAKLPVAGAFHSALMLPAADAWKSAIEQTNFTVPALPVYSNLDGLPYPADLPTIGTRVREHLVRPVEFLLQTMNMYDDGARTFIEVGPGGVLKPLIESILADRPHVTVSLDPDHGRLLGMLSSLGTLTVSGSLTQSARLFAGRPVKTLLLDQLVDQTKPAPYTPTTWFVNGSTVRPAVSNNVSPISPGNTCVIEESNEANPESRSLTTQSVSRSDRDHHTERRGKLVPELLAAYTSYHQNVTQFLKAQENALNSLLALAQSDHDRAQHQRLPDKIVINESERDVLLQTGTSGSESVDEQMTDVPHANHELIQVTIDRPPSRSQQTDPSGEASYNNTRTREQESIRADKDATGKDRLLEELVTIVSEYTGYPSDMLGLDLDIESELGIDSLRRMDIAEACLAHFVKQIDPQLSTDIQDALIHARSLREMKVTLQHVIDHSVSSTAHASSEVAMESGNYACKRSLPRGIVRPLEQQFVTPMQGPILVTEDELGIGRLVVDTLREKNLEAVFMSQLEIQDRHTLSDHLAKLTKIEAIVHLAGISQVQMPRSLEEWKLLTQVHAKSLFQILSVLSSKRVHTGHPLRVIAASLMGGCFGRQKWFGAGLPIAGASVGLLNTLALEWPGTIAKSLDFDLSQGVASMAKAIVEELFHTDKASEIGYPEGIRTVFVHSLSPHRADESSTATQPDRDWVVLATGGARGITADLLIDFVQPGMTVIAVGRSGFAEQEPPTLAMARTASEIRNYFIYDSSGNTAAVPQHIENRVKQVERDREIRSTLARITQKGATVTYKVCDMSNAQSVQMLLNEIYTSYGRIDAVIHGAGIIDDKLLSDKSWGSFDRVFDTKVDSAYLLAHFLRPSSLKLLVFMSSISGRIGNIGQADYAAANEVLNRFAWWLSGTWMNTRVISINWGPWASRGMVTAPVQAALKKRGIIAIDVANGATFLKEELLLGDKSHVEILAGEGPWAE